MEIYRRAAVRNRGLKTVLSGVRLTSDHLDGISNNVRWDAPSKTIEITAAWVNHDDGKTYHNFFIQLSLDDVTSLVTLLGHAGAAADAAALRDRLSKHIPALVKLLACATGLSPQPIEKTQKSK